MHVSSKIEDLKSPKTGKEAVPKAFKGEILLAWKIMKNYMKIKFELYLEA
jgi:hypothetical protein